MHQYKWILFVFCIFFFNQAFNQDSTNIMKFLKGETVHEYSFDNPDSTFSALEDATGYLCSKWNAVIKYSVLPFSFNDFLKDIRKKGSENKLIDSFYTKSNNQDNNGCFVMIEEFEAPKESNNENYILVMCLVDVRSDYAVFVGGSYPASKDALLLKSYIKSALSLRIKQ